MLKVWMPKCNPLQPKKKKNKKQKDKNVKNIFEPSNPSRRSLIDICWRVFLGKNQEKRLCDVLLEVPLFKDKLFCQHTLLPKVVFIIQIEGLHSNQETKANSLRGPNRPR